MEADSVGIHPKEVKQRAAGSSAPACSVPRRFVDDVDSLLTCLLYRHRKAVDATGEYTEIAKLAREARELTEAPNKPGERICEPSAGSKYAPLDGSAPRGGGR